MISPTANANGLAATGSYAFQANPDYENRGKALARYAIQKRGLRSFAVLSPSDTHGKLLAEAFTAEVIRLGGTIVASEWYSTGAKDLSPQLQNIRRAAERYSAEPTISFKGRLNQGDLAKLVQAGVSRKRLDSLVNRAAVVPVTFLLGPRGKGLVDSLQITAVAYPDNTDSLDIPMAGIEAIYCPISGPEEIAVLSSQIVYFNLQTQILGSGEWDDFAELNGSKRYCDGVVFESDNYPDETSPDYQSFRAAFQHRFGKPPGKNGLYGYDVTRMVLGLVRIGASTREAMARSLAEEKTYDGLHAKIFLAGRRVNSWLKILESSSDTIHQVDELNVDAAQN